MLKNQAFAAYYKSMSAMLLMQYASFIARLELLKLILPNKANDAASDDRYVMIEIQKTKPDAEGKYPYTGFVDCAVKTFKAGGLFKFYTGYLLYCEQIAPSCLVACIYLNQLRQQWEERKKY
ncbi:hypothetical protein TSUD_81590 [Trifolium subterraneum]|uniref:ADP/ATP translocase n=1 Tax=Trifolium subterraneum TaxID=3900 RepID=A0A2Z6N2Z9_TRISU|nr:hypothetical protein TSUD_81590 [Trifolium subterraneum]